MSDLFPSLNGFQSAKAAQIAAFFAFSEGGKIEKLKLIKLMYLAERAFMSEHDRPMLYDEFYSLKDGPICSATLNGINGLLDQDIWSRQIARNGNIVIPVVRTTRETMDEVSASELDVITRISTEFRAMTSSQLRNYTHQNCPEYKEVFFGRSPITYVEIFHALGSREPATLASEVESFREYEAGIAER